MIKTNNLKKVYKSDEILTTAVNEINLDVKKGEFIAIMGPSGCGKSSLLNILGLLDSSSSGEYWFDGIEVSKFKENQKSNIRKGAIGFIFQNFNLIEDLSVYDNVELSLLYLKIPKTERKAKVEEVLTKMDIMHRRDHFPLQLSGGQQQRVAIARAIVSNPKVIFADEPTGNLDSKNGEEVMNLLVNLNKGGTTIMMVTHSDKDASYAHKTIKLLDGKFESITINTPQKQEETLLANI
jgi:putative ABC transport system ATP-binding protein